VDYVLHKCCLTENTSLKLSTTTTTTIILLLHRTLNPLPMLHVQIIIIIGMITKHTLTLMNSNSANKILFPINMEEELAILVLGHSRTGG